MSRALKPRDILIEYRDRDLVRQGSIPIEDLNLKMQPVFNGVGSWLIQLPSEHRAVPYLRAPGAGIIVTNLVTGDIIMSGQTSKPSKKATSSDPAGIVSIAGVTDDRHLFDARAWPSPQFDQPDEAVDSNDVRTAKASTLMREYVNANIGPGSPAGRRGVSLRNAIRMGADPSLGIVTTRRPRYDVLGELLYGIAIEAGLGFRLVQVGDILEFQVYQPQDRAATIRLDVHNGTLSDQSVETAPPEVTRMIVAGQGEGVERQMVYMSTADATQAEQDWGIIIEEFKDQRQTNVIDELESAGMERLLEAGFTKVAVKATPANDQTMIFLTDFFMGDKVSVVIDGQEQPNSIITEAAIVVNESGMQTAVAIGDIYDFDSSSALRQTVKDTVRRVDAIERNVGVPIRLNETGTGTTAERDSYYGIPISDAQKVALANRQPTWFNTDKGYWENYYALNSLSGLSVRGLASPNPEYGSPTSGWYPAPGSLAYMTRIKDNSFQTSPGGVFTKPLLLGSGSSAYAHIGSMFTASGDSGITPTISGLFDVTANIYWSGGGAMAYTILSVRYTGKTEQITSVRAYGGPADMQHEAHAPGVYCWAGQAIELEGMPAGDTNMYGDGISRRTFLTVKYLGPPLAS